MESRRFKLQVLRHRGFVVFLINVLRMRESKHEAKPHRAIRVTKSERSGISSHRQTSIHYRGSCGESLIDIATAQAIKREKGRLNQRINGIGREIRTKCSIKSATSAG